MSNLSLSNIIRVSLLGAQRGLSNANTSALALITDEAPIPGDFGTSRVYLDATGVAQDFGSNSETYRLAVMIFSQAPNILTGGGFLVVIPRDQSAAASPATLISDGYIDLTALTATDYEINLTVDGGAATDLTIGELDLTDLVSAESSLNSTEVSGAGVTITLSGELTAARVKLVSDTTGATSDLTVGTSVSTGTNIATLLGLSGSAVGTAAGVEAIKDTILRTEGIVDYFGICYNVKMTDAVLTEVAALVQSLDKIQFVGSNLNADIAGIFTTLKDAGYTHTRMMYYSVAENDALDFAAGFASRGMAINFSAANAALTMHLKDITGMVADTGLSQTVLDAAKNSGCEILGDFGVPKVFTSGANTFFDEVYILLAFKLRLQVAGFNLLATISTKIAQTEEGMNQLKAAYRTVCALFVVNGCFAPGTWTGAATFGNPDDHRRNILDFGYFIYSLPISQQSQTERAARIAPVIQIAAKGAGAIHSSDVIVSFEA